MFKNTYQSGLLSIFFSCGSNPLAIWDMEVHNGHVKRLTDQEVNSIVLEIVSTNVATTYITCPKRSQVLGIRLPFLVMIVKNLKRYFSFEITILDDKNMRRRFRISNFQSTTKIKPFCTTMPIGLSGGWNQIQFNLADFTKRAYGSQFIETLRVQIHANVRLRRIYFSDRLYTEEELPQDYKLYLPLERKQRKKEDKKEEPVKPVPSKVAQVAPASEEQPAPPVSEPVKEPSVHEKLSDVAVDAPLPAEEEIVETPAEVEEAAPIVEGGDEGQEVPPVEEAAEVGEPVEMEAAVESEVPAEVEAPAEEAPPTEAPAPEGETAEVEVPTEEAPAADAPAEE